MAELVGAVDALLQVPEIERVWRDTQVRTVKLLVYTKLATHRIMYGPLATRKSISPMLVMSRESA